MGANQEALEEERGEKSPYLATEWSEFKRACVVDVLDVDMCAS